MTDFIDVLEQQLVTAHRGRGRRVAAVPWRTTIVFAGAVAAAAAVVVAVLALSSPQADRASSPPAPDRAASPPARAPRITASDVRKTFSLAVLNGTTVTGLARAAADRLTTKGYNEPNVVTNDTTNQARPTTQIFYEAKARAAALDVARILGVSSARVTPMDATARALADRARVAVFIGADRAK
jgi:LytR cell envelope-related transcriptional attenuator